jgi:hypothetical protein
MLRNRAVALFVAGLLAFAPLSALAAPPPDPCAPDVMTDLTNSAQTGFDNLNGLVTSLMKPPQSAASSGCMRDLFNIWDTDLLGTLGGAIASFISSVFPFASLLPGITLTEASVYKPIMSLVNTMISSNLDKLVCQDLWKGIQGAMGPVTINSNGTFGYGGPMGISFTAGTGGITIP